RVLPEGLRGDGADAPDAARWEDRARRDQDRRRAHHARRRVPGDGLPWPAVARRLTGDHPSLRRGCGRRGDTRGRGRREGAAAGAGSVLRRPVGHIDGPFRTRLDGRNTPRGRVGRGDAEALCCLVRLTWPTSPPARAQLVAVVPGRSALLAQLVAGVSGRLAGALGLSVRGL